MAPYEEREMVDQGLDRDGLTSGERSEVANVVPLGLSEGGVHVGGGAGQEATGGLPPSVHAHYHFDGEAAKGHEVEDADEEDDSPIEEVRLTVPKGDDPTTPFYTWRMWIVGIITCTVLSFIDQFFYYRAQPLTVPALAGQIVSLYVGRFLAMTMPRRSIFGMSLNPGPFNMKEHVLITIFANAGSGFGYGNAWGIDLLTIIKTFYKLPINFWVGMVIITCPQLLGYGWAGLLKKYVVEPGTMWWPQNLVTVSLFRTLHEQEPKTGMRRITFFALVSVLSFFWYAVPGYLFMIIACMSWICWIWPNSVYAHQIGSGYSGFGIGAFSIDWATISGFNGSPLATPLFAILNIGIGFALYVWVFMPIVYYNNAYHAKNFPLFAKQLYLLNGTLYDVTQIVVDGKFDKDLYDSYGDIYLPIVYVFYYGIHFAALMATFVHVGLYHGREIVELWTNTNKLDIHAKLMRRYPDIPKWWFLVVTVITLGLSVGICQAINHTMQIPWWGVIVVTIISIIITLPLAIITATTNFLAGLASITQVLGGYMFPGKPIANMVTNVWIYGSVAQAVSFLQDFKLGHYMKIPPRAMFNVQMVGTLYAAIINYIVAWWQLTSIKDICNINLLPENSPWTCPYDNVVYVNTIVWGLVGPDVVIGPKYTIVYWFLLIGTVAPIPVWLLLKLRPKSKFLQNICTPIFIGGVGSFPPAGVINYTPWFVVGVFFQYYLFNYHKKWWARYNYLLSAALSVGVAFMAILLFFALQNNNYNLSYWGNQYDNCPLASCPIEPGIDTYDYDGCPTF